MGLRLKILRGPSQIFFRDFFERFRKIFFFESPLCLAPEILMTFFCSNSLFEPPDQHQRFYPVIFTVSLSGPIYFSIGSIFPGGPEAAGSSASALIWPCSLYRGD